MFTLTSHPLVIHNCSDTEYNLSNSDCDHSCGYIPVYTNQRLSVLLILLKPCSSTASSSSTPPSHRSTGIVCVYVYIIMCYANNYVWWKLQTHRTCVERSKKSLWHSAPRSAMRERCGVQIKLKVLLQKCFFKTQSCCVTGDLCSFLFTCVLQHVTCFHKWFEAINPSMGTALTFRTRAGIRRPGAELKPVKVPGDVIEVCSLTTGL